MINQIVTHEGWEQWPFYRKLDLPRGSRSV